MIELPFSWSKISLRLLFSLTLLLVGFLAITPAEIVKAPHAEAELVAEADGIQPGKPFWVALRLKAEDEWHTYWQNPGDSGLATTIKWELPAGFTADAITWPAPHRYEVPPLVSFGYEGEVFLLVKITPPSTLSEKTVTLKATAKWLVCQEACIPGSAKLTLELPVTNDTPAASRWAKTFTETRQQLPLAESNWKFTAKVSGDTLTLTAVAPSGFNGELKNLLFFPFDAEVINYGLPQNLKKTDNGFSLEMKRAQDAPEPTELKGVIVNSASLQDNANALVVKASVSGGVKAATGITTAGQGGSGGIMDKLITLTTQSVNSLWTAILLSFFGGLILNLMPCVLPVLSIKVLDFVNQASHDRSKTWKHGLIFTAGVLVSFWTLALALIALRKGGEQLGWGFQMQSPTFLIFLTTVFFLFGLNLFGVFEVGTSLMNVGSQSTNKSGWVGSFSSGALATMAATPCTAPFMGSALGFALTQPIWASMLIFTSLALGMSSPYILLSFVPSLLKFIPKPGAWMETFKQSMGFLLMGTVIWLASVVGQQAGTDGIIGVLIGLVLMGIGAWIFGRWGALYQPRRTRIIAQICLLIFVGLGAKYAVDAARNVIPVNNSAATNSKDGIAWQTFSPELVEKLRAEGKPVFVDFTAAWCLSCKVNEFRTFRVTEVQNEIKRLGIVPLKADWTSRDETITKELEKFGRSGVPLYVLYNPKQNNPVVFPEVISPGLLLEEFKKVAAVATTTSDDSQAKTLDK
jgi:thiol:disulfide interchange protein